MDEKAVFLGFLKGSMNEASFLSNMTQYGAMDGNSIYPHEIMLAAQSLVSTIGNLASPIINTKNGYNDLTHYIAKHKVSFKYILF